MKSGFVYILTNRWNRVLYTGVTSDLTARLETHKSRAVRSFTRRYNLTKLVYVESCDEIEAAISREKQIKGGSREDKIQLIEQKNPDWRDLSGTIF